MSQMLAGSLGTVCMMDNVLVFGATQDDNLKRIIRTIQESGMTLNPEKCEFSSNPVKILGHQIDERASALTLTKSRAL